jgi:hypothetical protein
LKHTIHNSESGIALLEFVICLPLFTLILAGIIQFGQIKVLEGIMKATAYSAAQASSRGLDGRLLAENQLKKHNIDLTRCSIQVAKHVSIVNYYEARIVYQGKPLVLFEQVLPQFFNLESKSRAYVPKSFTLSNNQWTKDDEIYATAP